MFGQSWEMNTTLVFNTFSYDDFIKIIAFIVTGC